MSICGYFRLVCLISIVKCVGLLYFKIHWVKSLKCLWNLAHALQAALRKSSIFKIFYIQTPKLKPGIASLRLPYAYFSGPMRWSAELFPGVVCRPADGLLDDARRFRHDDDDLKLRRTRQRRPRRRRRRNSNSTKTLAGRRTCGRQTYVHNRRGCGKSSGSARWLAADEDANSSSSSSEAAQARGCEVGVPTPALESLSARSALRSLAGGVLYK